MRFFIFAVLLFLLIGCRQFDQNTYIEGTSLTIGLYVPYDGTIYGIQAVNYLSGKKIQCQTNTNFKVSSEHSISNNILGV